MRRGVGFFVFISLVFLAGCNSAQSPTSALDLVDQEVDWKKLDAVQVQFEQTYVDIEDIEGLRGILDDVILDDEPQPASKGWTFALRFGKSCPSALTLTKVSEKRYQIEYKDLEYKVNEHGPEVFEYLLDIFQQQGIQIHP